MSSEVPCPPAQLATNYSGFIQEVRPCASPAKQHTGTERWAFLLPVFTKNRRIERRQVLDPLAIPPVMQGGPNPLYRSSSPAPPYEAHACMGRGEGHGNESEKEIGSGIQGD